MSEILLQSAPLGKTTTYVQKYDASLLFPILRKGKREEIGVTSELPFRGYDIWNAFEVSWLNSKGKPEVAIAEFVIPCDSPSIIESKSFKLYLNSLNGSRFPSWEVVKETLQRDLSAAVCAQVSVRLYRLSEVDQKIGQFDGVCLDSLDIECDRYQPDPELLEVQPGKIEETVFSHLLKSNCLVTGQPDWGSILIRYKGNSIDHAGLLKYIVSLRDHNEFHEQCVERIFMDISRRCHPEKLTVYARYTRRGGLDINPLRTNEPILPQDLGNPRLARQ